MAKLVLIGFFALFMFLGVQPATAADATPQGSPSIFELSAKLLGGGLVQLRKYQGSVLLIVNTASLCGFTPQYADLESLYRRYQARGFVILGFPSNDFGAQEPGSNSDIRSFCSETFSIDFPMFEKAPVSGYKKQPVYRFLTEQSGEEFAGDIGWNFEKFLLDRQGRVRARFGSFTNPQSRFLTDQIDALLME